MDISPQNLMTTDVSTLIIPQLNGRELVVASRVCNIWYTAITRWEALWQDRLKQIEYCGKYTISKYDYPEESSTLYEKWRLLIKNLFQKNQENRPLLSSPLPYLVIPSFTKTGKQYHLVDHSHKKIKLIESKEEIEELKTKRTNIITKINDLFLSDLSLYSCDVQDKSFIHPYIAIEKKEGFALLHSIYVLALACFLKEGNPNDFFTLFKFQDMRHSYAVKQLVSLSLEQGNCEQALGWIKRYVDLIEKRFGIDETFMEEFGQEVIRKQKSGLLEELFLHLLSLKNITLQKNEYYKREMKRLIKITINRLSSKGHGEIMSSLIKKLDL